MYSIPSQAMIRRFRRLPVLMLVCALLLAGAVYHCVPNILWAPHFDRGKVEVHQYVVIKGMGPLKHQDDHRTPVIMPLGDEYGTDFTYTNGKCTKEMERAARQTKWLGHAFIPTIPILQWDVHASKAEYERLLPYGSCYGYKDVPYSDVQEALVLLNSTANRHMFSDWHHVTYPSLPACIRCAVVGSGGILNGSRMGVAIDNHTYVFRVNGAITRGHEVDVGKRTSFYFSSTNTMKNSLRSYWHLGFELPLSEETRYVFIPDHVRDYVMLRAVITNSPILSGPDRSDSPSDFFADPIPEKFKMLHPDFLRYLRNRFLKTGHWNDPFYRPSTGAVMLLTALHTCDQVDAYGFMTPDYARYSDHYYDRTRKKVVFVKNHDLQLEMKLWGLLEQVGAMRLYHRL
ncbi:alpha-N-acetylgalactosaminide alpha-2,6-sialyltransferase 2-like isoform X2 [Polypterus senegalus]|uniref:alpha-N-acetylgalactosaminide alpha-2,6-sialyltransferase 2-like isoform X2 n=1 Tax=Polypterus senegalus TaxID=55291 RepID=UPI001966718C|nr:alpha-N-acetylgalactosaminide alpha-2,6-sialyltransferase 2-like isoform X2 [Polypterus senegalus]